MSAPTLSEPIWYFPGNLVHPKRYVLDSKLRLKGDEYLLNDGLETTIFCSKLRKVNYDQPPVNILEAPGEDGVGGGFAVCCTAPHGI